MISIYKIKPWFQSLLQPCVDFLAKRKVTANQVTVWALVLSMSVGLALCWMPSLLWVVSIVLFVRMALNAIDGMLARQNNQQSVLGMYLNELGDIVSDAFVYLPFGFAIPKAMPFVLAIIFLSTLSETAGILGRERRYDGPFGKSDRAFAFGLVALLHAFHIQSPLFFAAMIPLLLYTTYNRIKPCLT